MVKHPFPEVPSALTCQATHFSESLPEMTQHRASLQLLRGAQFSKRLPPSIFWGEVCVGVGAVEAKGVLRITPAQPSGICNQFFTSARNPSLFLSYTSALSLSEPLLASSFGSLYAYMSDLY